MEKVVLWGSGIVGGEAYNVLSKSYEIKAFEIGRASCRERV